MKCLIIVAHPLAKSLSKEFSSRISSRLVGLGHQVEIEDLYVQKFDPVLCKKERRNYYEDVYDVGELAPYAKRLSEAEGLILVFPTWWFGFPAILKGWIDRVWVPGVAYKHGHDFGPIKPNLDKLKKVLVVTSLGTPWWVDWLIMRRPIKKLIKYSLLSTCAKNAKLEFLTIYNSENIDEKKLKQFTYKIDTILDTWK